eukprot:gene38385-21939_t
MPQWLYRIGEALHPGPTGDEPEFKATWTPAGDEGVPACDVSHDVVAVEGDGERTCRIGGRYYR